jgi:predicted transposase/invertase (TIGR01784 family)
MADKLIKKHDKLAKNFLSNRSNARDFVSLYLNPLVLKKCDLSSLVIEGNSYIDSKLNERFSDIVYRLNLKNNLLQYVYVYILVEHQSSAERLMPVRILRYQLEIIQKHIDTYKVEDNLPLVVPCVFYNGSDSPYPYATNIYELFADDSLIASIGLGNFSVVDLTIKSEAEILKHKKLALLEMCLKHISARNFVNKVDYILEAFRAAYADRISKKLFWGTVSYLTNAREHRELEPLFTKLIENFEDCEDNIMSYAEELLQQGMQQGMQKGEHTTKLAMVKEMLKAGIELSLIQRVSNLSKKEIEQIKKTIH